MQFHRLGKFAFGGGDRLALLHMQRLLSQIAETRDAIANNAKQIARLQSEIVRLQKKGADPTESREILSVFHDLHMQVLAVQALLVKALQEVGVEPEDSPQSRNLR
jgi:phage-related tail protein